MRTAAVPRPGVVSSGRPIAIRLTVTEAARWIRDGSMPAWKRTRKNGRRRYRGWPKDIGLGERRLREALEAGVELRTLGDLVRFAESGGAA
jgi:hypothetical protein